MNALLSLLQMGLSFALGLHLSDALFSSHSLSYLLASVAVFYSKPAATLAIEHLRQYRELRERFYYYPEAAFIGSLLEALEGVAILSIALIAGGVLSVWCVFYRLMPMVLESRSGWGFLFAMLLTVATAPPIALVYRWVLLQVATDSNLRAIAKSKADCVSGYRRLNVASIRLVYARRGEMADELYPALLRLLKGFLWLALVPVGLKLSVIAAHVPIALALSNWLLSAYCLFIPDYYERLQRGIVPGPKTISKVPYKRINLV